MPAIQPALLRQQTALLAEQFYQPKAFVRSLHHLLEFYSDRARRPGQSGLPPPLLTSYHVRPPVLRQLLIELDPFAKNDPIETLKLCDALWEEPFLEFRRLAISLLGKVSVQPAGPVIQRLHAWMLSNPERRLVEALLHDGCSALRLEQINEYLGLIENWLNHPKTYFHQVGLQALLPLVRDLEFENLPVIFRMIQPFVWVISPSLRADIVEIVSALANRSPQETAYFLRQSLIYPDQRDIPFLIRQSSANFPDEIRQNLLNAVR